MEHIVDHFLGKPFLFHIYSSLPQGQTFEIRQFTSVCLSLPQFTSWQHRLKSFELIRIRKKPLRTIIESFLELVKNQLQPLKNRPTALTSQVSPRGPAAIASCLPRPPGGAAEAVGCLAGQAACQGSRTMAMKGTGETGAKEKSRVYDIYIHVFFRFLLRDRIPIECFLIGRCWMTMRFRRLLN
jgi:hypothetical protein